MPRAATPMMKPVRGEDDFVVNPDEQTGRGVGVGGGGGGGGD